MDTMIRRGQDEEWGGIVSMKEVQGDGRTTRFRDPVGLFAVKSEIPSQLGLRSLQRGWKKRSDA